MNIDNKNTQTQESFLIDVKRRFFAQYWGQKVMKKNIEGLDNFHSEPDGFIRSMKTDSTLFLQLKSLFNYTDDDAIAVEKIWRKSDCRIEAYFKNEYEKEKNGDYKIVGINLIKYWLEEEKLNFHNRIDPRTIQHISEYLRSRGYALPFMEYSVEDLVSFGWVRLV
jgi:hypothetical protein